MATVLGFIFLVGGIVAINRALQFLWRPFMGLEPSSRIDEHTD